MVTATNTGRQMIGSPNDVNAAPLMAAIAEVADVSHPYDYDLVWS